MTSITTLLAATDFSTTAGRAEERAPLLAAQHDARLTLLHKPLWAGSGTPARSSAARLPRGSRD